MAYEEMHTTLIQVPRKHDWVMTKSKRIGFVVWEENYTNVFLSFPEDGIKGRSYKREGLVVLEPSIQKMLNDVWSEFVVENKFD